MQRYEGFWEYNALGYVSLLDSYVSHNPPKKAVRPPRPDKMRELHDVLDRFAPPLDQKVLTDVLDAVRNTFSYAQEAKFPEKYTAAIASTDADIVKIINLSDENFRLVKKMRDKVAHADALELDVGELQQIHIVVSKIELLLTYWAYLDFGLSKDDFLKGIRSPFTRLRRHAQINEMHLARVTGSAEFFSVGAASFEDLSSRNPSAVFTCFTIGPDREIAFSDYFTQMHKDWHLGRHKGKFTADQIFGVTPDAVRHVGHMYIECGERTLEFHSAYLFDASMLGDTTPPTDPVGKASH
ncbi:HEPN domain-containing protein [Robbsia andropogonis]|uniref:HEPN domain-containing protein n=1 Tax=Robbsia andropogonis TaxID=28092 RepID=UPI002A69A127|nr:HEPN domain-containing protein [Robbsia andropogonis]